jgi:5-methylcytosine-specific restriction protein A
VPGIRDRRWPANSRAKARCTKQTNTDSAWPTKVEVGVSPYAPAHPCGFPGCPMLVDSAHRRCEKHRIEEEKEINQGRGSASRRGYNARWRSARNRFLLNHPLCAECQKSGQITAATVVDHVVAHKGDQRLFWDESNWQALCKACHNRKTAKSDGRWG